MELTPDRPVAGGRMLARHDGRDRARGGRDSRRARARPRRARLARRHVRRRGRTSSSRAPTAASRPAIPPAAAPTTRTSDTTASSRSRPTIIADAFRRIGKAALDGPVRVRPSPEHGYRLRARLHVRQRPRRLFPRRHAPAVRRRRHRPAAAGNDDGARCACWPRSMRGWRSATRSSCPRTSPPRERVIHLEPRDGARLDDLAGRVPLPAGLTGLTTGRHGHATTLAGSAAVTDRAAQLFGG